MKNKSQVSKGRVRRRAGGLEEVHQMVAEVGEVRRRAGGLEGKSGSSSN